MNSTRKTAIIAGVLYIIGTVAGVLSVGFTGSIVDASDYLGKISASENQIITGALFVLTMGLALAMVPAVMFPILRKHNETLAVGYVIFRGALETFCYIGIVIGWLALISLGQQYAKAGVPVAAYYQTLGALTMGARDAMRSILEIVFPLGALMLYTVLYQSKLIPRWLSGWGWLAALLWIMVGLLGMFRLIVPISTTQIVLSLPIALQEMVMAVWLIAKGFDSSASVTESAQASAK